MHYLLSKDKTKFVSSYGRDGVFVLKVDENLLSSPMFVTNKISFRSISRELILSYKISTNDASVERVRKYLEDNFDVVDYEPLRTNREYEARIEKVNFSLNQSLSNIKNTINNLVIDKGNKEAVVYLNGIIESIKYIKEKHGLEE